jgi:GntR family transcriptional regulator
VPWDTDDLDDGPLPLWYQVAQRLRNAIEKGEFVEGDALPSESALNRRFGISRTTARAALDHLENDRLIARSSGRGSIVLPAQVNQPLNLLAGFSEDMRSRGLRPGARTLAIGPKKVTAEAAAGLGVERASRAVRLRRLFLADDRPIAVSIAWLHPDVVPPDAPTDGAAFESGSLYEWLERAHGARIAAGSQYIEAEAAAPTIAADLRISAGDPLLVARRTSRTAAGQTVEHVITHYRADRYRFLVELVRP